MNLPGAAHQQTLWTAQLQAGAPLRTQDTMMHEAWILLQITPRQRNSFFGCRTTTLPSCRTTHQITYFCLGKCDVICNMKSMECRSRLDAGMDQGQLVYTRRACPEGNFLEGIRLKHFSLFLAYTRHACPESNLLEGIRLKHFSKFLAYTRHACPECSFLKGIGLKHFSKFPPEMLHHHRPL